MKYLAILLFLLPSSLYADSYCKREKTLDVEFPAGLKGIYDIVGREPETNILYIGVVELDYSDESSPQLLEYFCSLGGDGNNYYRITCKTRRKSSESKEYGIEALFQRH